ncbi:hypothetical protein NDI45_19345 [Leptolyngbya sp. GB1-A1]|uniref:hypothetical protein n=1 Tax=Leptolyngbya sp. GB1-A1 TaxID=2933908 RepID=UPI00329760C0
MMTVSQFAKEIEHLLLIGAIEGNEVMQFYHLLMDFEQGRITAKVLQQVIDQHDPDQIQQCLEEYLPPLFD